MEELKELSPAQIKFVIDPKTKISHLLRLTFLDLVLRNMLIYEEIEKPTYISKQITRGPKFDFENAKPHEKPFLESFNNSPDLFLTLYELMKLIKEQIKNKKKYRIDLFLQPELTAYFQPLSKLKFFRYLFLPKHNSFGKKRSSELHQAIYEFEDQLNYLNKERVGNLHANLGRNILLVDKSYHEKLKTLFEKAEKQGLSNKRSFSSSSVNAIDIIAFNELTNVEESFFLPDNDSFDHTFDSLDSSSSSSNGWFDGNGDFGGGDFSGGDSGSSGCSGCGGCGS